MSPSKHILQSMISFTTWLNQVFIRRSGPRRAMLYTSSAMRQPISQLPMYKFRQTYLQRIYDPRVCSGNSYQNISDFAVRQDTCPFGENVGCCIEEIYSQGCQCNHLDRLANADEFENFDNFENVANLDNFDNPGDFQNFEGLDGLGTFAK